MLDLLKKVKNQNLRGLIVWVPMVPGDSAIEASGLVSPEKRFLMQAWDSQRGLGEAFAKTLHLNGPAWDVYLVYRPGITWMDKTPPNPSFWMHQLQARNGADQALHLRPDKLEYELRKALGEPVSESSIRQKR